MLGTKKGSADERLITTENGMHWTDKEVRKVSVHWALIMVLYRERGRPRGQSTDCDSDANTVGICRLSKISESG